MLSTSRRLLVVSGLMLGAAWYLAVAMRAEPVPTRETLASCPMQITDWNGVRAADFDAETLSVLGVDEYINRVYRGKDRRPVGLYVGYYGSQRQGDTMHSPLNCLPGAGWSPVSFSRIAVPVSEGSADRAPITINRYVIEKGLDRQLVLYWYQSHGRVVASEYWGKIYLVLDAIRSNRTDGALVRITTPIISSEADAEQRAIGFAQELFPYLGKYLPS